MNTIKYIHIETWMIQEAKLKGNELLIFALIHSFSVGKNGICTIAHKGFADLLGTSESRIRTVIKQLEEAGFIKNTKIPGYHHSYISLKTEDDFTDGKVSVDTEPTETVPLPDRNGPLTRPKRSPYPTEMTPNNNNNLNLNNNNTQDTPSWALQEEKVKQKEPSDNMKVRDRFELNFNKLKDKDIIPKDSICFIPKSKMTNGIIKKYLDKYGLENVLKTLDEAMNYTPATSKMYAFNYVFHEGVFTTCYNNMLSKQPKPEEPKRHFEKSIYEYCPDCGIGYSVWGECIVCGRKKPERIVDTSDVSKTMLRSE